METTTLDPAANDHAKIVKQQLADTFMANLGETYAENSSATPPTGTAALAPVDADKQDPVALADAAPSPSGINDPSWTGDQLANELQPGQTPKDEESWGRWGLRAVAQTVYSPVAGLIGALNETGKTAEHLIGEVADNLGFTDTASYMYHKGILPHLPEPDPDTLPGRVSKSFFQFAVGMFGAGKVLKAAGLLQKAGPMTLSLATGSAAAATVFDQTEENIGNIIKEHPFLQTPITNYMASVMANDPSNPEVVNRLKNALANAAIGLPVEGAFKLLEMAGSKMRAIKVAQDATDEQQSEFKTSVIKLKTMDDQARRLALFGNSADKSWTFYDTKVDLGENALRSSEVPPAPGYAYREDVWSQDHAAEDVNKPQIIERVAKEPSLNRVNMTYDTPEGGKYRLDFKTEEDRLAYIAENHPDEVRANVARESLHKAGWTDDQITQIGDHLSADIADKAKSSESNVITPDAAGRRIFTQKVTDEYSVPPDVIATALTRIPLSKDQGISINFGALRDAAGITETQNQIAEALEKDPTVRSWVTANMGADTSAMADQILGHAPASVVQTDSQQAALKTLWVASLMKLRQLANIGLTAKDTPGGMSKDMEYAFGLQLETHKLISNYWRSTGTEGARALNIRKQLIDQADPINRALKDMDYHLGTVEGVSNLEYLMNTVKQVTDNATPEAVKAFQETACRDPGWMRAGKFLRGMYTNNLLSSFTSLASNTIQPFIVAGNQLVERGMGIAINRALGDESGMTYKSLMQAMYGAWSAIPESIQFGRDAFWYGGKGRAWGEQYARGTVDNNSNPGKFMNSAYLFPDAENQMFAKGIDLLGYTQNWATRANIAGDEFHSSVFYRSEIRRLAYDKASGEVSSGQLAADALNDRVNALVATPPQDLMEQAVNNTHYNTFTSEANGSFAKIAGAVQNWGKGCLLGGWMLLPFKHVPGNILSYGFDHTPGLVFKQAQLRQALAQGGEAAQTAAGKIAGAALLTAAGIDLYQRGLLVGRGSFDPGQSQLMGRVGAIPYSLKLGDTYVRYNRMDAQGMAWGMLGDFGDMYSYLTDQDHDRSADIEKATAAFILSIATSAINKSYFQGIIDLNKALSEPTQYAQQLLTNYATAFVPESGALRSMAKNIDPDMHLVSGIVESAKANMPGLSFNQPPRFDLWGRPMQVSRGTSQTWNANMPFEMSATNPEAIDREMVKEKMYFMMPDKNVKMGNGELNLRPDNAAYARYIQLSGNDYIHPVYGMGCKDLLNSIVDGSHSLSSYYDNLGGGGAYSDKWKFIRQIITQYRNGAKQQLVEERPDLLQQSQAARVRGVDIQ